MVEKEKISAQLSLAIVLVSGALINWLSFQWYPDYAGPITAAALVSICSFINSRNGTKWSDFGLGKMERPLKLTWQVPLALVLTVAAGIVANLVFSSLIEEGVSSQSRFEGMQGNLPMLLTWVTIGWIVGGFIEEMVFRGFLLNNFEKLFYGSRFSTLFAVFLQAFLFGLVHFYNRGLRGGLTIFVVALTLGALYIRFGRNLWPLILAHGIVDTLSFVEDYVG